MWSLLAIPVFLYLAICAFLFFAQNALIFPAGQVGAAGPAAARRRAADACRRPTASDSAGVHIPPARAGQDRILILGFGGNATNAGATAAHAPRSLSRRRRGRLPLSRLSAERGKAGAAALRRTRCSSAIRCARGLPARPVVAVVQRRQRSRRYPRGPPPARRPDPGDSVRFAEPGLGRPLPLGCRCASCSATRWSRPGLRGSRRPVAIIAGGRDTLVVPARTRRSAARSGNLAFDRTIAEAGHNDIYDHPEFPGAMREALARFGGEHQPMQSASIAPWRM